mgnify:CR=1 FL=1
MKKYIIPLFIFAFLLNGFNVEAQRKKSSQKKSDPISLDAFKFRNIGPAFLSGRIADIAIHPDISLWHFIH